jgi:hypothetical protein
MRAGKFAGFLTTALCLFCLAGCGGKPAFETGSVSGKVTHHDGKPLTNAVITFLAPQLGEEINADLGPDGTYKSQTPVKVGNYQVRVTPPPVIDKADGSPPPKPIANADIPRKARDFATSQLTATIKTGKNEFNFDLKD